MRPNETGRREGMNCPKCNKKMIKRFAGMVLLTYPAQYPWSWWCGGCNFYCEGGVERGKIDEEIALEQWKAAQEEDREGREDGISEFRYVLYLILFIGGSHD